MGGFEVGRVVVAEVEVEEALRAAGGQPAPLDDGALQRHVRGAVRVAVHLEVDLDRAAQEAEFGVRMSVEVDRRAGAGLVVVRGRRPGAVVGVDGGEALVEVEHAPLGTHVAADLQAGLAAGDVEEAVAIGVADLHIVDGGGRRTAEIRGLGEGGDRDETGSQAQRLQHHAVSTTAQCGVAAESRQRVAQPGRCKRPTFDISKDVAIQSQIIICKDRSDRRLD